MQKLINWLKSLFIKSEVTTMTDTTASDTATTATTATDTTAATVVDTPATTDPATAEPAVTAIATDTAGTEPVLSDVERFAAKLKELVETAGSQAHAYFDDLVELAKKLI